ncbi:hypothetical protein K6O87_004155 [Vibrio vulnificus]|nr:hypothetical protein [Vibrio vulnificus]
MFGILPVPITIHPQLEPTIGHGFQYVASHLIVFAVLTNRMTTPEQMCCIVGR